MWFDNEGAKDYSVGMLSDILRTMSETRLKIVN